MRYSSRLFLYAPLIVLAGLAIAAATLWQSVAGGLETTLRRANGREIAPGITLRFASESVGGFPFNVDAVLGNVTVQLRTAFGPASWHTDRFALHELTFGRAQQIYEAAGTQTLVWTDAARVRHHFAFVPGSLQASAVGSQGTLVRFDLDINGIGSRALSGARAQLHFRKSPAHDAIDLVLSADDLRLAPTLQAGFGAQLSRLLVQGRFVPARALAPLFAGRESFNGALDAWRRGKGIFRLDRLDVVWAGVRAHAGGVLGFDALHRPAGTLDLEISGAPALRGASPEDERLADALARLTKANKISPLRVRASFASGTVNLRITGMRNNVVSAGEIGALY